MHSPTVASATSASDARGIIGQYGAECRLPGIALLSVELAKYYCLHVGLSEPSCVDADWSENITVLCGGGVA